MFDFIKGIAYFLDGIGLLTKPGIKRYVIIPLVINIILFVALFYLLRHYTQAFNAWFLQLLPAWLHWLSFLIGLLFLLSFFVFLLFAFVSFANLIAAPFNSLLSEKIENLLAETAPLPPDNGRLIDIPRIIGRQFTILFYYIPRALGLFILFFIPLLQIAAPIFWLMFNAWWMVITYYDYPSDNHKESFAEMRAALKERWMQSLGFGSAILFCSMVPIVNLVVMPAAVAGATRFWLVNREKVAKLLTLPRG